MKKEFFHSSLRLWEGRLPCKKESLPMEGECLDVQQHIRELMEERGWSEYKLAKMANLPQSTISNLFKRNNVPTLYTLEAICKAFGMTPGAILFRREGADGIDGGATGVVCKVGDPFRGAKTGIVRAN